MSHHGHRQTEFERVVPAKSPFGKPVRRIMPLDIETERDWEQAKATGHWPAVKRYPVITDQQAAKLAREELEAEFGPETPQRNRYAEIVNAPGAIIPVNEAAKAYYHDNVLAVDHLNLAMVDDGQPLTMQEPWLDLSDPVVRLGLLLLLGGLLILVVL